MTNLAHSPLGPSSADRWLACPASVRATEHVVEIPSRYAAEGTVAHEIAEESYKTGALPQMFLGQKRTVDGFEIEVDQEMCGAVKEFLDHLNDLPVGVDFNESRVHYTSWVKDGFGTLDRARVAGNTLYVRDLKYGKGVQVFAANNSQLKLYAAGFLEGYGFLFPEIEKCNLGIVQPRIGHIDEWEISVAELMKWLEEVVKPGALATEDPKAPYRAGPHCRFCKVKSTCMVRASSVFDEVVGDFENLDSAIINATVVGPAPVAQMTPDQIAKALVALPNVKSWCKDLEAHALRELQQGREIGGWFLTEGRSNRSWGVDEKTLISEAVQAGLPDPKIIFTKPELRTPADLEKQIGKRHALLIKPGIVRKPSGKPTLAPPGDPRKRMDLTAAADFEVLTDEG